MKLRALYIAVLMLAGNAAVAAPQLQTCEPMEITHSGSGLGYALLCNAGPWKLDYRGAVPAGSSAVQAQYRLAVSHPDGTNLVQTRTVRLPEPAQLGQALLREAVLLDNGALALRDCPDTGCTLYRPLGGSPTLAKASITVTPEVVRLTGELQQLTQRADQQAQDLARLTVRESDLNRELAAAQKSLISLKDQQDADMSGLESSHRAEIALERAAVVQAQEAGEARLAELLNQLAGADQALVQVRQTLAETESERNALRAQLAQVQHAQGLVVADVRGEAEQSRVEVKNLTAELTQARKSESVRVTGLEQQVKERDQAIAQARQTLQSNDEAYAALQAQLAASQQEVQRLSSVLAQASTPAPAATSELEALTGRVTELQGLNRELSLALAESDGTVASLSAERTEALQNLATMAKQSLEILDKYEALEAELSASNERLAAAQEDASNLYTKLEAARITQELSAQAAKVAHLEVDSLNLQVQGLTAEMNKALEVLTASRKEADAAREDNARLTQAMADQGRVGSAWEIEQAKSEARNAYLEQELANSAGLVRALEEANASLRGQLAQTAPATPPAHEHRNGPDNPKPAAIDQWNPAAHTGE